MPPGESKEYPASYEVTEADILAGDVMLSVYAEGDSPDPDNPEVYQEADDIATIVEPNGHVSISVIETSSPTNGTSYSEGEDIEFNVIVQNDGNITLVDISVICELSGDQWVFESLAPGASKELESSYTVMPSDVTEGSVLLTVTVEEEDYNGLNIIGEGSLAAVTASNKRQLTVNYYITGNNTPISTITRVCNIGERYDITTPPMEGFTSNPDRVQGTITDNTILDVYYTPCLYTLTIRYLYSDGTTAAPTYTQNLPSGATYSVTSPTIEGYHTDRMIVSGQMPARNVQGGPVIYVPNQTIITIDDFETPLGLGDENLISGETIE